LQALREFFGFTERLSRLVESGKSQVEQMFSVLRQKAVIPRERDRRLNRLYL